jgi:hypothetical protein
MIVSIPSLCGQTRHTLRLYSLPQMVHTGISHNFLLSAERNIVDGYMEMRNLCPVAELNSAGRTRLDRSADLHGPIVVKLWLDSWTVTSSFR